MVAITGLFCFCVLGCCHNKDEENKAAALGVSQSRNNKMMHDDPLYKYLMTREKGYKTDTQEFFNRIKAKRTPAELQNWAAEVFNVHSNDIGSVLLPRNEIPDFILNLDPPFEPLVAVRPKFAVSVVWGSGFGHWGLYLEHTNSTLPENPAVYIIDWAPGVQVFHDIQ